MTFIKTGAIFRVNFTGRFEQRDVNMTIESVDGSFLPQGTYDLVTDEGLHMRIQNLGLNLWSTADIDA